MERPSSSEEEECAKDMIMEEVSLVEYLNEGAPTIAEELLRLSIEEHNKEIAISSRLRETYMSLMQQSMRLFKRLLDEPIGWWTETRTQEHDDQLFINVRYRETENAQYVMVSGALEGEDLVGRLVTMERDYCFHERRAKWDETLCDIRQWQEYDCNGMGTARLVSAAPRLPWYIPRCSVTPRTLLGLQWDRVKRDADTATLLFHTLEEDLIPVELLQHLGNGRRESCFYGMYVADSSVSLVVRLPTVGCSLLARFLFKSHYVAALEKRLCLYQKVVAEWNTYYPNDGRVIR